MFCWPKGSVVATNWKAIFRLVHYIYMCIQNDMKWYVYILLLFCYLVNKDKQKHLCFLLHTHTHEYVGKTCYFIKEKSIKNSKRMVEIDFSFVEMTWFQQYQTADE